MLKDIKKLIRGGNIKTVIIIIGLLGLVLIFCHHSIRTNTTQHPITSMIIG